MEETEKLYTFYDKTKARSLAITQIIFGIMELLRKKSRISIADAIWHSVGNADWRKGECLESIAEFPKQLTVEKRKGMFPLKDSQDGSFQHKWLVDRIMHRGGFWIGRLVRHSTDHDYSDAISTTYRENNIMSGNDQGECAPQDQQLEDKSNSSAQEHAKLNIETPGAASAFKAHDIARKLASGPLRRPTIALWSRQRRFPGTSERSRLSLFAVQILTGQELLGKPILNINLRFPCC